MSNEKVSDQGNRVVKADVSLRTIEDSDLEEIDRLWRSDGWDYGLKSLRFHNDREVIPNQRGFAAIYQDKIIGTGYAFMINEDIGSLDGFFVKREYRNVGIGQMIWDARMSYLGDRNVMVNATEKRANKNVRLGFAHHLQELDVYNGIPNSHHFDIQNFNDVLDELVPISSVDLDLLVQYDKSIVKLIERKQFLKAAIEKYSVRGFVAIKSNRVVGYITESPAGEFTVIGPWYGDTPRVSEALVKMYISMLPKQFPVMIASPTENESAKQLIASIGLCKSETMQSLFTKNCYDVDWSRIYGIFNLATFLW